MTDKKGVGAVIAWVLLLGFTVALATTIFLWMKSQTETLTESTVEHVEGELQCQNVRINVIKSDGSTCGRLDVSNKGYVVINQLSISSFDGASSSILYPDAEKEIKPQSTNCKPENNCGIEKNVNPKNITACKKIEVMPIIRISNRKVGCKDRMVVIEC